MDYTNSGFNSFLTKSLDDMGANNLESAGASLSSTQLNYDNTQVSSGPADTFNVGNIQFDGKGNTITLNDGSIIVNDSDKEAITIANGEISYTDQTGVVRTNSGSKGMSVSKSGISIANASGNQFLRTDDYSTQVWFDDANERVLLGYNKDGFGDGKDYGIKVSQVGNDVSTAADNKLIMSSGFNMFKIVTSGTIDVDASAGTGGSPYTATVAHGLLVTPAFNTFINVPSLGVNAWLTIPYIEPAYHTGLAYVGINAFTWADPTNLNFRVVVNDAATSVGIFSFKYYIFQETAN